MNKDDDILKQMCKVYGKLYKSNNINVSDLQDYLKDTHIENILSDAEKDILEKFSSLDECKAALFDTKENKSPGIDRLPCEFYKHFWEVLKDKYYSCITNSYEKESVSYSQRVSIFTLLFKKGDKNLLGNYRPISLTNTYYKIIAFIFARRLLKVLDSIISQNQSAYVKGRFIGINARLIIDIF